MSQENELSALPARTSTTEPLKAILRFLPNHVVDVLEDHADTYGLSDVQVLELAIVNLLDSIPPALRSREAEINESACGRECHS